MQTQGMDTAPSISSWNAKLKSHLRFTQQTTWFTCILVSKNSVCTTCGNEFRWALLLDAINFHVPFTKALTNCFHLLGSFDVQNPTPWQRRLAAGAEELRRRQMGCDRMRRTWHLSSSFKCSSSISPRCTSCCGAPLKSEQIHNSLDC